MSVNLRTTSPWSTEVTAAAILHDLAHRDPIRHAGRSGRRDSCRFCFAVAVAPTQVVHRPDCVWSRAGALREQRP